MALQRPGLIRHGRCRSRALVIYQRPLIIHAGAISSQFTPSQTAPSLWPSPLPSALLFVVVCATGLHAHGACARAAIAAVAHPSHGPAKRTLSSASGS